MGFLPFDLHHAEAAAIYSKTVPFLHPFGTELHSQAQADGARFDTDTLDFASFLNQSRKHCAFNLAALSQRSTNPVR